MPNKRVAEQGETDQSVMFVRPAVPGLIVRYPAPPYERLPDDGAVVPKSAYWLRALKRGDIVRHKG